MLSSTTFAKDQDKAQIILTVQKKAEIAILELEEAIANSDEEKKQSRFGANSRIIKAF